PVAHRPDQGAVFHLQGLRREPPITREAGLCIAGASASAPANARVTNLPVTEQIVAPARASFSGLATADRWPWNTSCGHGFSFTAVLLRADHSQFGCFPE